MVDFVHLHVHRNFRFWMEHAVFLTWLRKLWKTAWKALLSPITETCSVSKYSMKKLVKSRGLKRSSDAKTYVARRGRKDKVEIIDRKGDHLILLAKNPLGYSNLVKLISYSWIEGHYYKPRIDKELLRQYHEGWSHLQPALREKFQGLYTPETLKKRNQWYWNTRRFSGMIFILKWCVIKQRIPEGILRFIPARWSLMKDW